MKNSFKWHVIIFVTQCVILAMLVAMLCSISYVVEYFTHGTSNDVYKPEIEPTIVEETSDPVPVEETYVPYFNLTDSERHVVESIVMGESGNQSYEGQLAVAECLLNACILDGIQPSEARVKYQYSGWNENPSDSVVNAVSQVFDDGYRIFDEQVLWFYNPDICSSSFHESQTLVGEIGDHRFFAPVILGGD